MKHFYNSNTAANKPQPIAKATGTAISGKLFTLLLLGFFLLVSGESYGQAAMITNINPKCGVKGQALNLTIVGTGFKINQGGGNDHDAHVVINGNISNLIVPTSKTSTELQVNIPASRVIGDYLDIQVRQRESSGNVYPLSNVVRVHLYDILPTLSPIGNITASRNASCGGQRVTYSIPVVTNATSYNWVIPSGASVIGATNSNSITLEYTDADLVGTVSVSASNNCFTSGSTSLGVVHKKSTTLSGGRIDIRTTNPDNRVDAFKPATFIAWSEITEANDVASYAWFITTDGENWTGVPNSNSKEITIASVPENLKGVQVLLYAKQEGNLSTCYSNLPANRIVEINNIGIVPLPVELVSFNVKHDVKGAKLVWATASELDNKGFEVQVSTDSRTFVAIGFVESKVGTTSLRQDYSFLDTKAVSGTRYYRLKQIDLDGTTSLSPIRAIVLDGDNGTVAAYPNPFNDVVTVKLTGTESRRVKTTLTDAMGKVMLETTEETTGNSISVDTHNISTSGMYMLHVYDNDTKYTFKLMKR